MEKLEPKVFNDLEVLIKKQAAGVDGRKDFWQKIVDGNRLTFDEWEQYDQDLLLFVEKLSLITNEECPESNILPVEAMKFLQEEAPMESIDIDPTGNAQEGEDEDLVSDYANESASHKSTVFLLFFFQFDLI